MVSQRSGCDKSDFIKGPPNGFDPRPCWLIFLGLLLLGKRTPESVAMKKIMIPVIAAGLVGCSSTPTEQEIGAADFGQSMTEEACLAVATPFITARMGDPDSVIFEGLKCYRGLEGECLLRESKQPTVTGSRDRSTPRVLSVGTRV